MEALYLKGFLVKIVKINGAIFDFSRENIKRILLLLVPSLKDKIDDYERKNFNKEEKKEEEKPQVINEIHKKIEDDKNICIKQNTKMTTPDMSASDKISNDFSNLFETINCESKSIGNYIHSNK